MLNGGGLKLAVFLGLSALGHGLLLYPWSADGHYQVVAGHDGSVRMTIVAHPQHSRTPSHESPQPVAKTHDDTPSSAAESAETKPQPADRSRILAMIDSAFKDHFYYPAQAIRFGIEGQVLLGFEVYGDGSIHNIKVLRSSGSRILDLAAVDALTQMGKLPQLQAQLNGNPLSIELPVKYQRT